MVPEGFCTFCCVCKLEDGFRATLRKDKNYDDEVATTAQKGVYSMKHMVAFIHASCSLRDHYLCIDSDKFIFSLPQFKGLSCFEIAPHGNTQDYGYSTKTLSLKCHEKSGKDPQINLKEGKQLYKSSFRPVNLLAYFILTSHPIYVLLHEKYGLDKKKGTFVD